MKKELEQIRLGKIADTDHEIFALLKQRYSPRTFREEKIKKGQLNQLFEAARWSASSNNLQPWRFIYAEKGSEAFEKIVDCLSDFNKKWAPEAPLLMLAIYKETTDEGKPKYLKVGVGTESFWTTGELLAMAHDCEKLFEKEDVNLSINFHGTGTLVSKLWEISDTHKLRTYKEVLSL